MTAYATVEDVAARTGQRLRERDRPSAAAVRDWLDNGSALIDGAAHELVPPPPFTSDKARRFVKELAIDYAASRVYGTLQNLSQAERLQARFDKTIEAIRSGYLVVPGHRKAAQFRGARDQQQTAAPRPWRDGETRTVYTGGIARR